MAAWTEVVKALHHSLSLANGKMRILSTIVQAFVATVIDVGQDSPHCRWVTRELVGDDDSRLVAKTVDDPAQKPFGGMLITPRLDQDVEHDAVLIDGSPQPVAMATDGIATSSRCHLSPGRARPLRSCRAKAGPNLAHQCRTVS